MKKILISLIYSVFSFISIQAQIITTWAGRGNGTLQHPIGDSLYKSLAKFSAPGGGRFDKFGNYLFSDGPSRIRKIDTNGIITTVVGTGISGYSGVGGPAVLSQIWGGKLDFDSKNNIYFTTMDPQTGAGRILKVDAQTGILSLVAGCGIAGYYGDNGPAINARFNGISVYVDKHDNLYALGDWSIRKIDTNGIITRIAGVGIRGYAPNGSKVDTAQLGSLDDMCFDSIGNMYVVDKYYNVIRKIDTLGIINTIAGTIAGYNYNGDSLLATNAMINPTLIAIDKMNNLYFSDWFNNIVRVVKPNGMMYTIAGTGAIGYSGNNGPAIQATFKTPLGVAIDKCGNLYVPDRGNICIRKINLYPDCGDTIGRYYIPTSVSPLQKTESASQLSVYPNPVLNELFVEYNALSSVYYSIYALNSAVVLKEGILNADKSKIDVTVLPKGVYIITFNLEGALISRKFIKD
jgi:sugar lactone lactonase YvrE